MERVFRRGTRRGAGERRRPSRKFRLTPPRLLGGSFLLLIASGTIGLKAIPGIYTGASLGWLDALFTSTSASCVTGLIVVDTATYFTPLGHAFLLLLIQLGGLGIITFGSLVILALGGRLTLHQQAAASAGTEVAPDVDFRHLLRNVFVFTFLFEGLGAALLFLFWRGRFGWAENFRHSLFHSISAFCNAGFSTFSDNLKGVRAEAGPILVIGFLILVGGIGFLTMEDLYLRRRAAHRGVPYRLSINTRIVLLVTALLVVLGAALFLLFEWSVAFRDMPAWAKPHNALFMSITPRTAGFNTIDYAGASASSVFLTMILMFIGGSPGSTAGGVKTTTAGLMLLLFLSRLKGSSTTAFAKRTIPDETIHRAILLCVVATGLLATAVFLLTATETGAVAHADTEGSIPLYTFEAVSAFNTVGLSLGSTADFSAGGKAVLILLMYLGRIGPLTFVAAITLRKKKMSSDFHFAYEDVVVG